MALLLEVNLRGEWHVVGRHTFNSQAGSFTDHTEAGRQVYVFQADIQNGKSVGQLFRSLKGIDLEGQVLRVISTEGFEVVATLQVGQSFEMVRRGDDKQVYTIRLRME